MPRISREGGMAAGLRRLRPSDIVSAASFPGCVSAMLDTTALWMAYRD